MNLLKKRRDEKTTDSESKAISETKTPCAHMTLIPRWDSAEDIGHEDRATSFACEACGTQFTPARAQELRATEAARLQRRMAG